MAAPASSAPSLPHLSIPVEQAKTIAELAKLTWPSTVDPVNGERLTRQDPEALARFRQALVGMDDRAGIDLIALIWIGRGDFILADWDKAQTAAKDIAKARLAGYIEGIPLVSDYLIQGLPQVGAMPKT